MSGYSDTYLKGRIGYNTVGWPLIVTERARSDKPLTPVPCEVWGLEHEMGSVYLNEITLTDDLHTWERRVQHFSGDPAKRYFKGKLLTGSTASKTWRAKVWYQDFSLNVRRTGDMILKPEQAVLQRAMTIEVETKQQACEVIFAQMNERDVPPGHPERAHCEKAGHTSMSVGDYVTFDGDEGYYVAANQGFERLTLEPSL